MADWLLNIGRTSDSAAKGDEVGEGPTPSGAVRGEGVGVAGVVSGVADGTVSGVAVTVASGVVVTVASGVAVGVASGVAGVGVETGVVSGDDVVAGVEAGGVFGAGDGEFAGCPPEGAAGCCSHPARKRLAKAKATTKHLIIQSTPTHELDRYSRRV